MKRLEKIPKLKGSDLRDLISKGETFVLYVRSQKDFEKIREIFDVDIVFPELVKSFGEKVKFFWCDIDETEGLSDFGIYFSPVIIIFKDGSAVEKLEGIKSWSEYNRALRKLIC